MKICRTKNELQEILKNDFSGKSIGFVPTMGALHEGHHCLVKRAINENQICVVSIYLNSTQFNDPEDLESYPASLEQDISSLQNSQVNLVFLPNYKEIYPDNYSYRIHEIKHSLDLCGKNRPGHFDGVLTVVMKLFNIVRPTKAYFGEKDYQQLELIRGMVEAYFMDVQIIACPIVRDNNGLALSSRNKKLKSQGLQMAKYFANSLRTHKTLGELKTDLEKQNIQIDYLKDLDNRRYAAVKIENVRLIDNVQI